MKNLLLCFGLMLSVNAMADIEFTSEDAAQVSDAQVSKNHACFEELSSQGCGGPGEDHQHFRSCMNNVFPKLSKDCQKMMSNLYGKK